jgi:two-component system, NtrC family, response regulator HydG
MICNLRAASHRASTAIVQDIMSSRVLDSQIDSRAVAAGFHRCSAPDVTRASTSRILIVESDVELGLALSNELAVAGYRCDIVPSGSAALGEVARTPFDAVISDLGLDGMGWLETLTREQPRLPIIVVTDASGGSGSDAMDKGAFHYFTKPLDFEELRGVIEQAIGDRGQLGEGNHTDVHRNGSHGINGDRHDAILPTGAAARALLARIERFATAQYPVLIQGESGTGKELVARAIHDGGARASHPFIAVNTAAIPEHLLESELFGHVRGAFTGATQARRGLLTEADHGTLLLDEIGDMPLGLQAKLLRVIQFGEVRAIGSDRSHFVDVRFLAATHRNLKAWAEDGRFRADLYYRLSVLELNVPALRDRRSEIPALVTHFLAQARERKPDSPVRVISPDALRALAEAPWPGNIRELASTVERLVVLGQDAVITTGDLASAGLAPVPMPLNGSYEKAQRGLWTLDQLNHQYVDWILAHVSGDKTEAARILGINISTLYRWLREHRAS